MKTIIIAVVVMALGLGGWWGYSRLQRDLHVDVDASEIHASVSAMFPLKKCILACMEFHSPVVQFAPEADRVTLATQLRASLGPIELPGKVAFDARLRYDAQTAAVYLADIRIPEAELSGVPPEIVGLVKQHGPLVASTALLEKPVYRLRDAGTLGAVAERGLKSMAVTNGKLRLTFQWIKP